MTIDKKLEQNTLTLSLAGRLDTTTSPQLEAVLDESLPDCKELIFDFSELKYISSAGLRLVLKAQKTMNQKGTMKITHANEEILEVFDITGFSDILSIE